MDFDTTPFSPLVNAWRAAIDGGLQAKNKRFQKDADEGMNFFAGPYDFFFNQMQGDRYFSGGDDKPGATVTVNKVAEMVQIFGPVLYHKNPDRQVTPRATQIPPPELYGQPNDPAAAAAYQADLQAAMTTFTLDKFRADLYAKLLNAAAQSGDMKSHNRRAVDEAIIRGAAPLWTVVDRPPGSDRQEVRTVWDSVENLVLDPSADCLENCRWVARKVRQPVWEVERDFRLPPGTVRPCGLSPDAMMTASPYERDTGAAADTVVWWQVFSKMGCGGRFPAAKAQGPSATAFYELFGDYCYLAVCDGCRYPLNLPPGIERGDLGPQLVQQAVQWPTPFWMDRGWPFVLLSFHEKPGDVWPISHLTPAMGELKFLNWFYSKIVSKIRTTCRDFIAVASDADKAVREAIESGDDLTVLEISGTAGKTLREYVEFLQHPGWQGDIWKVAEAISEQFERRTGLTELAYGESSRQLRSAAEAELKSSQVSVRPDDMANKVEDVMSLVARRELIAARWHLTAYDVAPVLGPASAPWWDRVVSAADPRDMFLGIDCRVEAGSARKPNKQGVQAVMKDAMTTLFPSLFQYFGQTGNPSQVNALVQNWAKSIDFPDPESLRFQAAPPPLPAEAAPPKEGAAK